MDSRGVFYQQTRLNSMRDIVIDSWVCGVTFHYVSIDVCIFYIIVYYKRVVNISSFSTLSFPY